MKLKQLLKKVGALNAAKAKDNHEEYSEGPDIENEMDQYNNAKGRASIVQ